jgi:hypothetical protein
MNPLQEATFIGGDQNGARAIVDTTQSIVNVYYQPKVSTDMATSIYYPHNIKVNRYALHLMMSGQFIAVHESLTLRQALELIISRYPKKRKPRGHNQKLTFKKMKEQMDLVISMNAGLPASFNYTP